MADETEIERMVVRLTGDGSSFQKMLKDGEKQAEDSAKRIEEVAGRIEGFNKGLAGFAQSAVSALGSIGALGILKGAFNSYVQLEQGQLKLKAAIESNGGAVDELVPKYSAFATSIAEVTLSTKGEVMQLLRQAEIRGQSGEKAQQLVQQSIALAAATDGEASSILTALNAARDGNSEMLKRALRLRGIKDETELNIKINKLLAVGWKTAQAEGASLGGQIDKLNKAWEGMKKQLGPIVAEYIRPVVEWTKRTVDIFKNLDDQSKRLAVGALAAVAAFLGFGPALAILKTAAFAIFSPLILAVNGLVAGFALLASPIGLVTLAVAALTAEVILLTGTGPKLIQQFKDAFEEISNDVQGAIKSIGNAIKGGDLQLAFDIAWAQIQLSFLKATSTMQTGWINFKFMFLNTLADLESKNKSFWEKTTDVAAHAIIEAQLLAGQITKKQADEMHKQLNDMAKEEAKADAARLAKKKADLIQGAKDAVNAANDQLNALTKKRDEQDELAAWEAFFADTLPQVADQGLGEIEVQLKDHLKKGASDGAKAVDAALAGSAEALSRMAAYDDALKEIREGGKGAGAAGQGGGAAKNAREAFVGPPAPPGGQIPVGGAGFPAVIEKEWVPAIKNVIDAMKAIAAEGQKEIDKELAPNWIRGAQFNAGVAIGPKEFSPEDLGLDPKAFPAKKRVAAFRAETDDQRLDRQAAEWEAGGGDPKMLELLAEIRDATKKQVEKKPGIDLAAAELEEV